MTVELRNLNDKPIGMFMEDWVAKSKQPNPTIDHFNLEYRKRCVILRLFHKGEVVLAVRYKSTRYARMFAKRMMRSVIYPSQIGYSADHHIVGKLGATINIDFTVRGSIL